MTAFISAPIWKIRIAAKMVQARWIRAPLCRGAQISQNNFKKSVNVAFSACTGAEGQQSQCPRDRGGAA